MTYKPLIVFYFKNLHAIYGHYIANVEGCDVLGKTMYT